MKVKVLFFIPGNAGGAERMALTVLKILRDYDFEVEIALVCNQIGTIGNFLPDNVVCHHIKIRNIWDFTALKIAMLIRKVCPDVVYGPMCYLNPHIILGAKLSMKSPRIVVRNDNSISYFGKFEQRLMKYTYKYVDKVIAQQNEMKEDIHQNLNIDNSIIIVLQNPVDKKLIDEKIKEENPFSEKDFTTKYVQVSRVSDDKGLDVLLKAFKIVHSENPQTSLHIVGAYSENDSYYMGLQQYIQSNKLNECVKFVGFVNNPYKWIKNSNCLVLASRREGLPNVLIEAMYIGIPVVATKCIPIIDRIVRNGENGLLVPTDDVKGLARAMLDSLSLKKCTFSYQPASEEDFIKVFKG